MLCPVCNDPHQVFSLWMEEREGKTHGGKNTAMQNMAKQNRSGLKVYGFDSKLASGVLGALNVV